MAALMVTAWLAK